MNYAGSSSRWRNAKLVLMSYDLSENNLAQTPGCRGLQLFFSIVLISEPSLTQTRCFCFFLLAVWLKGFLPVRELFFATASSHQTFLGAQALGLSKKHLDNLYYNRFCTNKVEVKFNGIKVFQSFIFTDPESLDVSWWGFLADSPHWLNYTFFPLFLF